ncbi:hypothetical protein J2Z62_000015 [Mycoplasmoides fastidiosum]|uniref:Lipoprotein-associated type-17 domain-containing protein n=1 Tax=Mycoplasmoides fastidiosum TaxID=92758 RepID=A0ABU0LXY3_9BACT|nr:lipoprotein 17-related variable surface protein [Mycoplasmoides fastidiosum]MDQ0513577.1 hypothetical protein [Mycoplasmoides fastidiosum]UUD38001.1 lipoprotein 17-related variable surface protein [Mycoplasmoides fastidiosum]
MKRFSKFWLLFALSTLVATSGVASLHTNYAPQTFVLNESIKHTAANERINFNATTRLSTIISDIGPVLMDDNNTIFQLDWFGNRVWSTNVFQSLVDADYIAPEGTAYPIFGFPKGVAVIGWTYSSLTKKIYLLIPATRTSNENVSENWKFQYVVPIDPKTGILEITTPETTPRIDVRDSTWNGTHAGLGFQFAIISQLGDGSIVIYGLLDLSGIANGAAGFAVFSPGTNTIRRDRQIFGIRPREYNYTVDGLNFFYVSPITTVPISPTHALFFTHNQVTNNIYVHLTDNNFALSNKLWRTSPLRWVPPEIRDGFKRIPGRDPLVLNNNYGFTNNYYFNTVNNETWLPYLDKIFFIRPNGSEIGYETSSIELPKLRSALAPWDSGIIYSSYLDLRGDLFFNMATWDAVKKDWNIGSTIYKLSATTKRYTPYADLATSDNPDISKNTSGFKIFAIPVQVGKIMLINKDTGVAVAVDEDPAAPGTGRIIGTLNGAHSFLRSPDFSLNLGAQFLLPSQLQPQNFRASGTGSIVNYEVLNVDDSAGTIEVKATINYVPWFENATSTNVNSTQVTKIFNGLKTTSSLRLEQLDYQLARSRIDFIDDEAIKRRNLFNLTNNHIDLSVLKQLSYEVNNPNFATGEFQVIARLKKYHPVIDPHGPVQNLAINKTYQALPVDGNNTDYRIDLIGGSSLVGGQLHQVRSVNINSLPAIVQFLLANSHPTALAQKKEQTLDLLIDRLKLKGYPLFKLDTQITANAQNNQLTISITVPAAINEKLGFGTTAQTITTVYTGFNNKIARTQPNLTFDKFDQPQIDQDQVIVNVNNLKNRADQKKLSSFLPSEVNISHLWNYFFAHNDFNLEANLGINLFPDNVRGTLGVTLTKQNHSTLDLFKNHEVINVTIQGFKRTAPEHYQQNGISFANANDERLLQLQRSKNASEVSYQDINQLVSLGADLSGQMPNFQLTAQNTRLLANNNLGELSVIITLPFENRSPARSNQIGLPNVYQHTFRNFSRTQANTSLFQVLNQEQLTTQLDLSQLTKEQVFANLNSFILRSKGYRITSVDQITVSYSKTLDVVYITYDFSNQRDLEPDSPVYFTAVYKLSQPK